ncbi:MAG TPA: hypothetical protein VGA44_07610 [Steroidobacteraceae bacterium]
MMPVQNRNGYAIGLVIALATSVLIVMASLAHAVLQIQISA